MRRGRLVGLVAIATLAAAPVRAQEPDSDAVRAQDSATVRGEERAPSPGRLRLLLDDTVLSKSLAPKLAFSAAMDQAKGSPDRWGGGADAYGKRLAARAGLVLSQTAVEHGTAALMRVDPRGDRTRCGCTGAGARTKYALTHALITRDARGRAYPNIPLAAGAAGGALIARAWYPDGDGPGHDAAKFAAMTVVGHVGKNVLREFSPELKRLNPFKRKPKPTNEGQRVAN